MLPVVLYGCETRPVLLRRDAVKSGTNNPVPFLYLHCSLNTDAVGSSEPTINLNHATQCQMSHS